MEDEGVYENRLGLKQRSRESMLSPGHHKPTMFSPSRCGMPIAAPFFS